MIKFPAIDWVSATNGNKFGDLVRTKNISLDKDGYLSLARKAQVLYSLADDAGFGTPISIVADNQYIYVVTAGHFYVINTASATFSILEASATNQPTFTTASDAIIFNGKVVASGDTTVSAIPFGQGQTWPNPKKITGLGSNPHPLCVVEHLNQFAVGDGNTVKTYDTSYSLQATLTIPAEHVVTTIRWRHSQLYIGTRHIYGGDAKLFIWNATGSTAQDGYTVPGTDWIYSLCEYQSSMVLVTSAGQILRYNGGGFDVLANFPVYYTPYSWTSTAANNSLIGKVANRGMDAVGDKLHILIDGSLNNTDGIGIGSYLPEQPSGLWTLDPKKGLYHRSGVNYIRNLRLQPASVNSSYLGFSSPHQALTGDAVLCSSASGLSGVTSGDVYYAIVDATASTTTCRLALSPADAYASRSISITGTPNGSDLFYFDRYEAMGATAVSSIGGLCILKRARLNLYFATGIVFGASALDETLTAKGVLMGLGMGRNRGNFVLPRVTASDVLETIQRVCVFLRSLRLDTDAIVLKYRTTERFGMPTPLAISGSATWTSSTTFTVDSTTHDVKSIVVGDEVEIVKGAAAGYTAHILTIDTSTSTYAYTIDETMPVSSGSFDFVAQNWTKLAAFTNSSQDNAQAFAQASINKDARWVELKVEMRGVNIELDAIALTNAMKQPL